MENEKQTQELYVNLCKVNARVQNVNIEKDCGQDEIVVEMGCSHCASIFNMYPTRGPSNVGETLEDQVTRCVGEEGDFCCTQCEEEAAEIDMSDFVEV